jgi:hypothetical protein
MSRKSMERFCDNDMHKVKDLKRDERHRNFATRFGQMMKVALAMPI